MALEGAVALVTGGSRGIGRSISERLAAEGALVAVHYGRDADAARSVVKAIEQDGGSAFVLGAPLGEHGDAERLFDTLDQELRRRTGSTSIDVLVNNAGIAGPSALADLTPAEFDRYLAVNARAPFFLAQQAAARLRDGGRLVNVSTGLTQRADPTLLGYSASKAPVEVLTRHLAKEWGPRGITVNTVAPGVIDTDMNAGWLHASPATRATVEGLSPLGRLGQPADVADVVAFLCGDGGRWVTGQLVDTSGGALL